MKLFSRKALAAVATTFALTTAGVSAPAMAATSSDVAILAAEGDADQGSSENKTDAPFGSSAAGEEEEDEDKAAVSSDPKALKDWAGAAGAIITVLTTLFTLIQKLG